MLKHSSIIFTLLLLLLTACRSDDFQWNGKVNTEEEIAVAFRAATYNDVEIATRATEPSAEIKHIYLLVFDGENLKHNQAYTTFINSTTDASNQAATVKRTEVCAGTWVVVANGESVIGDFLSGADKTLTNLRGLLLSKSTLLGASNALMAAEQTVNADADGNLPEYLPVFNLTRRFSKFTFKVKDGVKFLVTGVQLYREATNVKFNNTAVTPLQEVTDLELPATYSGTNPQATAKKVMTSADKIDFFSLPISNKMATATSTPAGTEPFAEARLIIEGYGIASEYDDGDGNHHVEYSTEPSYFAYKFDRAIAPNTYYTMTLEAVEGNGHATIAAAAASPVGVAIDFKEQTEPIKNMVTDGQNVIAVPDTIRADYTAQTISFDVYWRAEDGNDLKVYRNGTDTEITNSAKTVTSWASLTQSEPVVVDDRKKISFTLNLTKNEGSDREGAMTFKISGVSNLEANLVIVQGVDETMNLDQDLDITLTLTRGAGEVGGTLTNEDYLKFVGNTENDQSVLFGIKPAENGGRVRNAGLHFPMPNGNAKYKYTVTAPGYTIDTSALPAGIKCTSSGNSHTFETESTFLSSNPNQYIVYEDAITFTKGDKTLTLDIYHTGFFHKSGSNWLYYEVFTSNGQLWLDRNVNATSAGMAHMKNKSLITGEWPISVGAQGALFSQADAASEIPQGYKVPSQGDFEQLTVQKNFTSNRYTVGANTIFLPAYNFTATTVRNGRPVTSNINAYFPHNQLTNNSQISGDNEAGYYWTTTQIDTEYYRCYKFEGQNATAENMAIAGRNLSVRAMAGSSVSDDTYTYSMQCKGYTHVFLYVEKDGVKTYLNTWPGTEVAIGDMATKRYNPFSYTSYVEFKESDGYKLYVILNKVTTSGTTSNVNSTAAKARNGIPLVNGGTYDINASTKLVYPSSGNYVISGNWVNGPVIEPTTYTYKLWGQFTSGDWSGIDMVETNGKWVAENKTVTGGNFGIQRLENGVQQAWLSADDGNKANFDNNLGESISCKVEGTNFSISAGTYTFTYDPSANTLTVTGTIAVTQKYRCYLTGTFDNWGRTKEMTYKDGKYVVEGFSMTGDFGIERRDKNNENNKVWIASDTNDTKTVVLNTAMPIKEGGKNNFTISQGTYTLTFDPEAKTLTVTGTTGGGGNEANGVFSEPKTLIFYWADNVAYTNSFQNYLNQFHYWDLGTTSSGGNSAHSEWSDTPTGDWWTDGDPQVHCYYVTVTDVKDLSTAKFKLHVGNTQTNEMYLWSGTTASSFAQCSAKLQTILKNEYGTIDESKYIFRTVTSNQIKY